MARMEAAALELAAAGYHVLPCEARGKQPLTTHGWQDASGDRRKISGWFGWRWLDANIGVACEQSGIAVLDIDTKHGAEPKEVIAELGLDDHPTVWTGEAPPRSAKLPHSLEGERGAQVFFSNPDGLGTAKEVLPGCEVRGGGAYVIVPPSCHPSGVEYEGELPRAVRLEPMPEQLAAMHREKASDGTLPAVGDEDPIEQGERHEALLGWAQSALTARGVLDEPAFDAMWGHNVRHCEPPLEEKEVRRLWKWLNKSRIAQSERVVAAAVGEPEGPLRDIDPEEIPDEVGWARKNGQPPEEEPKVVLPFAPLSETLANTPPEPDWLWRGYLAPGTVTLLAGKPKVGKSTMLFELIAALGAGRSFLGLETAKAGVLLLSEERESTLQEKRLLYLAESGLEPHVLMRYQLCGCPWPDATGQAVEYCADRELVVLVVDTLDKWTGLAGDAESKAGAILVALEPLMVAAGDGLAVVISSHQRKAAGTHGEAVRGSNALVGSVDVVAELERVTDTLGPNVRVLKSESRFAGTPQELACELTETGYVARDAVDAMAEAAEVDRLLKALKASPDVTITDLVEQGFPKTRTGERLGRLLEDGAVTRTG